MKLNSIYLKILRNISMYSSNLCYEGDKVIRINKDKQLFIEAYIPDFLSNANQEFINYTKTEINKKKIRARKELRLVYTQKCNYNCSFCHAEGIRNKIEDKLTSNEIINLYKYCLRYAC